MAKGRLDKKYKNKGKLGKSLNSSKKFKEKIATKKKNTTMAGVALTTDVVAHEALTTKSKTLTMKNVAHTASGSAIEANGKKVVKQVGKKEIVPSTKSSGFIFMCNRETKSECFQYHVFGLPSEKMEVVKKVKDGAKLFLYDFDLKLLYGIYKANGNGGKNLEPSAFGGEFPAQVRFYILKDCFPLPETTFKHAIKENYQSKFKFKPELSARQVKILFSLFRRIPAQHLARAPPVLDDDQCPELAQLPPPDEPYQTTPHWAPAIEPPRHTYSQVVLPQHHEYETLGPLSRALPLMVPSRIVSPMGLLPHHQYGTTSYLERAPPVLDDLQPELARCPPPDKLYGTAPHLARALPVLDDLRPELARRPPPDELYGTTPHLAHAQTAIEPPRRSQPQLVLSRHDENETLGHLSHLLPLMEPSRLLPSAGLLPDDRYGMTTYLVHAPLADSQKGKPYLPDAERAYLPERLVVRDHDLYSRYVSAPEMILKDRLPLVESEHRALVQRENGLLMDRLDDLRPELARRPPPGELHGTTPHLARAQTAIEPPRTRGAVYTLQTAPLVRRVNELQVDRLDGYYSTPRTAPLVQRGNELQVDCLDDHYSTLRTATQGRAGMPAPTGYLKPAYEEPARPVALSSVSASSLYSFADAVPAYRGL